MTDDRAHLENEESDYSEMLDPNNPQYEPGRSDVDSDIV